MKTRIALIAILFLLSVPAFADTYTIGGPGDAFIGDCAPFGCGLQYQQIYDSSQFAGAFSIGTITFFNNNFVPGSIAPANYVISLSTTSVGLEALSATFADNLGADNQVFFSGALGGPIDASNEFTITGTAFNYDPSTGNLLMTVSRDGDGFDFSAFLDFTTNATAGTFSRAYSFGTSGIADFVEYNSGLVTRFASPEQPTSTPEPSTVSLLTMGLGAFIFNTRRYRRTN